KPVEQVVEEVRRLVEGGHGEIVFTGIRLGLYRGRSESGRSADLTGLLRRLADLPGRFRIRLSSLEVTETPDRLIALAAETDRVCPHFHIPLQSASDRVLADMGRWYRYADYRDRVRAIRERLPHAAITADVLTGFPTEDEAAYDETFRRIEGMALSGLHAFPYSPRPGTTAAGLKPWPAAVLKERTRRLVDLSEKLKADFRARFVGTERTALAEDDGRGWTDNYIRVRVPAGAMEGLVKARVGDTEDA
ncbi:MAG: radical SAM protein, partial [Elusimicrobia bacterium]|nr:radical SAM protein [Elusimicrobiota bacterium]